MSNFMKYLDNMKVAQWILIGAGLGLGITASYLGINDNPPGIIALYISLACLAAAWIWNLPAPKDYWIILLISLAAFPVGGILHNAFYGLAILSSEIPFIKSLMDVFQVFFFLVAVMAAGPTALVALIGGIVRSWSGMSHLTYQNRSIRRFKEKSMMGEKRLRKLVNLARQSASGANLQPLKYVLSHSEDRNQLIYPTLSWAGYLKDWQGPEEGERPSAYIILLGDTDLGNSFQYDAGIACQSITLGAAEMGWGACLIGSIKRETLRKALAIPEKYEILLVIALGKPAEIVIMDALEEGMDIQYWRDEKARHHVPKRDLDDMILEL